MKRCGETGPVSSVVSSGLQLHWPNSVGKEGDHGSTCVIAPLVSLQLYGYRLYNRTLGWLGDNVRYLLELLQLRPSQTAPGIVDEGIGQQ